jgi:hypothetical protein
LIPASVGCRFNEIRQLLPNLHYIYAFDNVAFPYGEKSEEFIVERVGNRDCGSAALSSGAGRYCL